MGALFHRRKDDWAYNIDFMSRGGKAGGVMVCLDHASDPGNAVLVYAENDEELPLAICRGLLLTTLETP
jgi:hypothetical protein